MSYLSLLNYTKDIAESLSTEVLFVHGRKEVLHELRRAPEINQTGIVFWSLPFISSGTFTDIGQQFNETVTVNFIVYKQDALGSEMDQDDPEKVQSEINVLAQTKDLADEFIRQFNFNTISIEAQEISEELEIAGIDFDNVIKDNDFLLTGTFVTINVQVPDEFNYCDVQFLTSVSYTNNFQSLDSSFATMVPTLLPEGATATYSATDLPSGLALDANTGEISEDDFDNIPDGLTTFFVSIEGTGSYGGSLVFQVVFCKGAGGGEGIVTGLTYTNDTQTIWQESGNAGVFETPVPTVAPCDATGTFSSGDLPAGLSLDTNTGLITVSDFSLIPTGTTNFTVTFTGSGSFSGSANDSLSVTKETLWTPLDLTDAATRVIGFFDFSENGTLTIVDNEIRGVTDRSAGGNDLSQTSNIAYVGSINGVRAGVFINTNYLANLGVSSSNFNLFYKTNQAPGTGEFVVSRVNTDYIIRCNTNGIGQFDQRIAAGTSTTFSFPVNPTGNEARGKVFGDNFYTLNIYYSGSTTTRLRIDGGESYDSGDVSGGTLAFDFGTDFFIGSRGTPVGQFSAGAFGYFLFINDSLTTDERQRIEGWDAHLYSTTDKLAAGHPYKSLPPFV